MIELVSSQTDTSRDRKDAEQQLHWVFKRYIANVLRVAAGAGRAYELSSGLFDLMSAMAAAERNGVYSDEILRNALRDRDWRRNDPEMYSAYCKSYPTEAEYAMDEVVDGCMRLVAAELLAQPTQESAADNQIHSGIRRMEVERERRLKGRV